jgi:hypothetical protein
VGGARDQHRAVHQARAADALHRWLKADRPDIRSPAAKLLLRLHRHSPSSRETSDLGAIAR